MASKYPPGTSLFLVPFTLPGWRFVFVSGLVLALAGAWMFLLVLRRFAPDADPSWALLYLFYPAVVLYSRTVMSDLLAATLTLAAFYCLLRSDAKPRNPTHPPTPLWALGAGAALGYSCLVRYANAVLVPVFITLILLGRVRRARALMLIATGIAPFAALALGYNALAYGGPLKFPMHLTTVFSLAYAPANLWRYCSSLALLYPLMLIAPLAAGRGAWYKLALPAAAMLLTYSLIPHPTPGLTIVGRTVTGLRYLLPAVPFLVLGYSLALHRLARRTPMIAKLKPAAILIIALAGITLQWRHQRMLQTQDACRRALLAAIPQTALLLCNVDASKLLSPAWGTRRYRLITEHGVPVELARKPPDADTLYAAYLEQPGRPKPLQRMIFETTIARYPGRVPVLELEKPCRVRVLQLRPGAPPARSSLLAPRSPFIAHRSSRPSPGYTTSPQPRTYSPHTEASPSTHPGAAR